MNMQTRFTSVVFVCAVIALSSQSLFAQFARVTGTCRDAEGKPIANGIVRFVSAENGRKYELKTNAKGEYMSIGIASTETYKVTFLVDGKEVDHVDNYKPGSGENPPLDFDLKAQQQEQTQAIAQKSGMTAAQVKEMQQKMKEHDEAVAKEGNTVKALNEKMTAANTASAAGDFDTAIASLNEATAIDANRDLIWYKLGEAYTQSVAKQTDPAEKAKRLETAVTDYQKAIELKKAESTATGDKKPDAAKQADDQKKLAAYYNGLGNALGRSGRTDDAVQAYTQASQVDPTNGGMYFFNLGAVLTNANKAGDQKMARAAADAFDKAIAADPTKADAYFWKGSNLVQLATLKGDKMVSPDGTAEAFQKYLELKPDGPHAGEAKAMLEGMGASIETSYGKKKAAVKKP
jgi:tetratricopeptide (TPR) repeat protein